jgi:pseudaminic acid biosynthesis-associated methylase
MTKQLDQWRGSFGENYIARNGVTSQSLRGRTRLWAEILQAIGGESPDTILEVGANIGINLRALGALTDATFYALEPNDQARKILENDGVVASSGLRGGSASAIDFPDGIADLVFTSGVLIHIPPAELESSCREIYRCARRFIVCIEYFSDNPQTISYRDKPDLLFKRDFGGYWLDLFPSLVPVRWGFAWKRTTGLDNLTWWLFRK